MKESFFGKNRKFPKTQKNGTLRIVFRRCEITYFIIWRR